MSSTTRGPFFFAQVESRNISTPKKTEVVGIFFGGECCLWTQLSTFSQSRGPITLMTFKQKCDSRYLLSTLLTRKFGSATCFSSHETKKTRSQLAKRCGAPKKTKDLPTLNQNMIFKYWGTEISGKKCCLCVFLTAWRFDFRSLLVKNEEKTSSICEFPPKEYPLWN